MKENLRRRLLILIASLVLVVAGTLFVFLMLPVYIYRLFISYLTFIRPDLDSIVEMTNVVFIPGNFWKEPRLALIMKLGIKGEISSEKLKDLFMKKIMIEKMTKMKPQYSRLQQYPYKWLGYYFWKWEENFNIDEHIYDYSCEKLQNNPYYLFSKREIMEIESSLLEKPFARNISMWEIILLSNVASDSGEDQTLLYFRLNHAIADGYSLIKFGLQFLGDESFLNDIKSLENANRISWKAKFLIVSKTMVQGLYDTIDALLQKGLRDVWKNVHHKETEKLICSESKQISMDIVKESSSVHGIEVSALIYSAYTSALRKALLKNRGSVPKTVCTTFVLPMCDHPDRLTNHMTGHLISLPVGESNILRRSKIVQSVIGKAKNSTFPFVHHYIYLPIFALFPFVTQSFYATVPPPVGASSFPGLKNKLCAHCYEVQSMNFVCTLGFVTHRRPIALTTLSYANKLQFWISGHNNVFTQEDLDEFARIMEKDIQNLKEYGEKDDDQQRISKSAQQKFD